MGPKADLGSVVNRISVWSKQQTVITGPAHRDLFTLLTEIRLIFVISYVQGEGRAIPVQAWTGQKFEAPIFKGIQHLKLISFVSPRHRLPFRRRKYS